MADAADWVFESVLQFLKSPLWRTPVHGFIEEHCSKFDPTDPENKIEYTMLHKEFCTLVDGLLSGFLGDLGISGEDFIEACKSGTCPEMSEMVTEYIVSMDDFQSFRSMMERNNHEMDLEAMHEYARFVSAARDVAMAEDMDEEERFLFEMAIKASLHPTDVVEKEAMIEDAELLQALAMSMALEQERLVREQQAADDERRQKELQEAANERLKRLQEETLKQRLEVAERLSKKTQEAAESTTIAPPPPAPSASEPAKPTVTARVLAPVGHGRSGAAAPFGYKALPGLGASATAQPTLNELTKIVESSAAPAAPAPAPSPKKAGEPTEDEIKKRAEYMKAQREALLKLKRENREKELAEYKSNAQTSGDAPKPTATDEARAAFARRFKEDLIDEARRAGAANPSA